ncbi:conserved hypothetical protein [Rubrivivax sp. A210]|uniref:peroxide stress protein YaaA n=1 Tax=Rubrivivax sp. A210 TaxID=2772301 RepID=UPI001918F208|nr:peroxide stress protein YaaA [Rubrivivax sp. A210]CAD5373606.1 conserved hypothetical protein [Rubrivivax sp. A210]
MLLLLSPAKTLDYESPLPAPVFAAATEPLFADQASALIAVLRRKSVRQVAALMDLSPALAELNVARYAAWQLQADATNSRPALLAFAGDVYDGLQAATLGADDLAWAQQHLVMLSGLYGALRPLDLLQPYRLEMGTALKTRRGKDLYAWWGDRIAAHLNERQAKEVSPVVLNLASIEYARAARRKALRARVVDCVFEEVRPDGSARIISFFAKKARGMMARHAIARRATRPEDVLDFAAAGYAFDAAASAPERLVFRRRAET